jgi:hypothetical protein
MSLHLADVFDRPCTTLENCGRTLGSCGAICTHVFVGAT